RGCPEASSVAAASASYAFNRTSAVIASRNAAAGVSRDASSVSSGGSASAPEATISDTIRPIGSAAAGSPIRPSASAAPDRSASQSAGRVRFGRQSARARTPPSAGLQDQDRRARARAAPRLQRGRHGRRQAPRGGECALRYRLKDGSNPETEVAAAQPRVRRTCRAPAQPLAPLEAAQAAPARAECVDLRDAESRTISVQSFAAEAPPALEAEE